MAQVVGPLRRVLIGFCWVGLIAGFVALLTVMYAVPTGNEFRLAGLFVGAVAGCVIALLGIGGALIVAGATKLLIDLRYVMMLVLGLVASLASVGASYRLLPPLLADLRARWDIEIEYQEAAPSVLVIRGLMPSDIGTRLRMVLSTLSAEQIERIDAVELSSPGGQLRGMAAAVEVLRGYQLTHYRAVGECQSACALMWLQGDRRSMAAGALLGFHAPTAVVREDVGLLSAAIEGYLACETGDPSFANAAAHWPNVSMYQVDGFWMASRGLLGQRQRACKLVLPPDISLRRRRR